MSRRKASRRPNRRRQQGRRPPSCATRSTARFRSAASASACSPRRSRAPAPNASVAITLEVDGGGLIRRAATAVRRRHRGQRSWRSTRRQDQGRRPRPASTAAPAADARARRQERRPDPAAARACRRAGISSASACATPAAARSGSVLYDLDVPDFSKDAAVDERAAPHVGQPRAACRPRIPTPNFKEVLPAPPSALREFPANDTSWRCSPRSTTTRPRSPHRVAIKSTVIADNGTVVFNAEDERKSEELKGAKGRLRPHRHASTLKGLAPGRYVLRRRGAHAAGRRRQRRCGSWSSGSG